MKITGIVTEIDNPTVKGHILLRTYDNIVSLCDPILT